MDKRLVVHWAHWGHALLLVLGLTLSGSSGHARTRPHRDAPTPPLRLADAPPAMAPAAVPPASTTAEISLLPLSELPTQPESASSPAKVSCRPEHKPGDRELKVVCTDGQTWTMRSAGLILPPVLRCSPQAPECCEVGFRKMSDVQLADLLRVAQGQAPLCHIRVKDFLTNPPSRTSAAAAMDRLDDEVPPGLRESMQKSCPKGQYLAMGSCHDARQLMRALRAPQLVDPNRSLVPEADAVVERMRREFDAAGRCPQAALDIEVLLRIYNAAQLRAALVAETPLDVAPLLALAQHPAGAQPEPQLPASCGYNATFKIWYQTTFHCATPNMCFAQSHQSLAHACVRFDRAMTPGGSSPYFWPTANCTNVPSCATAQGGECTGVARLTALGRGIFLMIQEDPRGVPYYYGVLFARQRARTPQEAAAARQARALLLDMAHNLSSEAERERLRALIEAQPQ